ncbi:GntP family permease [Sinirhodobacter populi]|uniref:GntP family permease n=1 Tax=Paenirhodobacter populi TaxID=2306993 RepID=A0A443K9W9_9RHOB|nr:GntP family permease [Sinirhodobacter populi]RWR29568.1 GntP family permease [Sinirhodobacter populi]
MSILIALFALGGLMLMAYRGYSVIIFAPVFALLAVLLTDPAAVAPAFSGLFMDKMVGFIKNYFPVFLLGAIFGKVIELSGFSRAIVAAVINLVGRERAILVIVLVCALLTYGGVSLFVVVFAVYPFAAEMFRQSDIPKRLMPGTIALGAFTFTMDAMPGTPQIQNIIPTAFFGTTGWAAPWLGLIGAVFIFVVGLSYLEWRRRQARVAGEGYGTNLKNEPATPEGIGLVHPVIAIAPLVLVGVVNFVMTHMIPKWYGSSFTLELVGLAQPIEVQITALVGIWSVLIALLAGILFVLVFAWKTVVAEFSEGTKQAAGGAMLATMNTASEYGFGAIIAALPGFLLIKQGLAAIPNPLINEAVTINLLAGITGSASGGLSIALGALADQFIATANAAGIPMEVLHRVASMASGGMDTLPHNGAVITLLAVTGLTHRQAYGGIFAMTCIKTFAAFMVIGVYYLTGIV